MSFLIADEGTVCFNYNVVLVAVVDYSALLAPRVKLIVNSSQQRETGKQPTK